MHLTFFPSFPGGGLWHPDAGPLALLRRAVDRKPHKLKQVLTEPGLGKEFFGGIPKDERKAVKAFVRHNEENMLKTKPKVCLTAFLYFLAISESTTGGPAELVWYMFFDIA